MTVLCKLLERGDVVCPHHSHRPDGPHAKPEVMTNTWPTGHSSHWGDPGKVPHYCPPTAMCFFLAGSHGDGEGNGVELGAREPFCWWEVRKWLCVTGFQGRKPRLCGLATDWSCYDHSSGLPRTIFFFYLIYLPFT